MGKSAPRCGGRRRAVDDEVAGTDVPKEVCWLGVVWVDEGEVSVAEHVGVPVLYADPGLAVVLALAADDEWVVHAGCGVVVAV